MMRIFILLLFLPFFGLSQNQKLVYDFNQCSLSEQNQMAPDIVATNNPVCNCGLDGDAIELNNQSLIFPLSFDTFFYNDFSLGFSVLLQPSSGDVDIFSKMKSCNHDTSWSIVYRSADSVFVCTMQQGFDKIVQLEGKIDPLSCWQQLMVTRSLGQIRLYINGEIKAQTNDVFVVRLNSKIPIGFNKSPCMFINRVAAKLDQVIIANYAMNSTEVINEYILQDEIITPDTLIFKGASVQLRAKSNCATNVQWSPATNLSATTILDPIATPVQQIKYFLKIQQSGCIAEDSILIKVVDTSLIECSELRLPTAFTPNQDQLNDRFFISNNYIIEQLNYFDILDRNGSLIVRFTNPQDSWDGTWNGTELTPGSYYYRISYTCKEQEFKTKGSFFLMR